MFDSATSNLKNSCRPPWHYIIVPSPSDCLWTATDGHISLRTAMEGSAVLQPQQRRSRWHQTEICEIVTETRDKAAMPANITAGYRACHRRLSHQPLGYSRRKLCSQSANTLWGRSGLQRYDIDWEVSYCSFFKAKDSEGFSSAWYTWQRCVKQQERWLTVH